MHPQGASVSLQGQEYSDRFVEKKGGKEGIR